MDQTIYACIQRFLKESKDFADNPNVSVNVLNECLDTISKLDFSTVSCGRVEVALFFSNLWEVMSHSKTLHWNGISVLANAAKDKTTRYSLVHDFKFYPLLAEIFLTTNTTIDNKINLLILLEDFSQGIKINWEEPYLVKLMDSLCGLILEPDKESDLKHYSNIIFVRSLSILVNMCYQNTFVTSLLMKTVDTRVVIKRLMNRKDNTCGNVQVCRLLMALHNIQGAPTANDVHNYIGVAMHAFISNMRKLDENDLCYINLLLADLCSNPLTRPHVMSYENFEVSLQEALKVSPNLFSIVNESSKRCINTIFSILLCFVKLDIYSLRVCHKMIANLCVNASNVPELLGPALSLLASIVSHYEEDGMLPDDLMPTISIGFNVLLDPKKLDPKTAGLDWMRFVSSLCDCHATREAVFVNVNAEKFEEIFRQNLQYLLQSNNMRCHNDQELVLIACHICLSLTDRSNSWVACLHRILASAPVAKILSHCLSNTHSLRRNQFLQIIRHTNFPMDKINKIFVSTDAINECNVSLDSLNNSSYQSASVSKNQQIRPTLSSSQQCSVDELIKKVGEAVNTNKLPSLFGSSIIELYGYKMNSLEHRLNSCTTSLTSANKLVTSLSHSISILEGTNQNQENLLYRTQVYNERLEENLARLSEQMNDAEKTIKKFQGKLAAERLDREQQFSNAHHEHTQKIKDLESQILKNHEIIETLNINMKSLETTNINLTDKLNDQTKKNSELAGVLVKFEERVKQREKKIEETSQSHATTKQELDQANQNIKTLEKTILEKDKKLTQLTTQLEEMQRIQEMIANLMGTKSASSNMSTNSLN